jgi:dUTP pyrophosphatase
MNEVKAGARTSITEKNDAVRFCKVRDVRSPERGTPGSAGIDFFIPNDIRFDDRMEDIQGRHCGVLQTDRRILINSGGNVKIPLGVRMRLPKGYSMLFVNKSGIATKKNLAVGAQLIDEDYTGQPHVHLYNFGNATEFVEPGMKIVQGILIETNAIGIEECDEGELFDGFDTERGDGSFGHTGI